MTNPAKQEKWGTHSPGQRDSTVGPDDHRLYLEACRFAEEGRYEEAQQRYRELQARASDTRVKALIRNDLAALAAVEGEIELALTGFEESLAVDKSCELARSNLALLESRRSTVGWPSGVPDERSSTDPVDHGTCKVAILSFLFNWPSTGGGIIHTVELAQFLSRAGYEVQHFYARNLPWGVGSVTRTLPISSNAIDFDDSTWNVAHIQRAFRQAVERFDPDYVMIMDCWNFKPHLAESVRGYPYFLRQQALECLCPLNNLRLMLGEDGEIRQCRQHQLATPEACVQCLQARGMQSGGLHQVERALSGVGTGEYQEKLRRAFGEAEAVLVLNPLTAEMIGPYARAVRVVPWGMDPARFPWPWPDYDGSRSSGGTHAILMAGLVSETIKGFRVLHDACRRLWKKRRDFELLATAEPVGRVDEFTRFVGWLSQDELPRQIHDADILVMPTIAQEGLGRTTVEAMAVGRPVIASRIGGLPYTVKDGATGLLFEPGNSVDLAEKIELLLDDPDLRRQMGIAGRQVFEQEFTWDTVIDRYYRPLLVARTLCAAV